MGGQAKQQELTTARRVRPRPTPAEVAAAADRLLPDLIAPDLDVLFCGINPGLYSAATGWHFARPGNRFWPALHRGGFTPHLVDPADQAELLGHGLGITNLAARASARADELTRDELVEGGRLLVRKVRRYRPRWVAVLGVTAYRTAFERRTARIGRQPETIGGAHLWVLPNPSGLNAHFTGPGLAAEFAALRAATLAETRGQGPGDRLKSGLGQTGS
ncbi:G/U mismatch-specific DNA glycosylase [Plantactinospora mayteni]|uniref:Mismatch-specific DNA-glycosylase n=1 Tax=Plantactinospora mayteni TaxID=566021 RepID=A0ABQ4F2H4_9ACTN|nr:mismatch-specific DNA-glycosylase [Plantactinospora mayteni]